jgi:two-component sensor histidine kinase
MNAKSSAELAIVRRHRKIVTNLSQLAAHQSLSSPQLFQELVVRVAQAMEINHVKLLRYRQETSDLLVVAGCGWKPGFVGSVAFPADMTSPTGRTFRTGQPSLIEDINSDGGFRVPDSLKEHGIASLLNVPVIVNGAAWGVLEADSTVPSDFSSDTLELLFSAAALVSIIIARTQIDEKHQAAVAAQAVAMQRFELLLSELHHRVKNNFQMLLALIIGRKSKFPTPEGRMLAQEFVDAIIAMALAHEQLTPTSSESQTVDLDTYLGALASNLEKSNDNLIIQVQADKICETVERAAALGLIVNELVRNAVKHTFSNGNGQIRIKLCEEGIALAALEVSDDGAGKSSGGREGSGTRLVKGLARQLGGDVEWISSTTGTTVRTVFPIRVPEKDR